LELDCEYLQPLGIKRENCWITDLVRVFLFKEGHIEKYRRLNCPWPEFETRSRFEEYAQASMEFLMEELRIAAPRVIITLGTEVAGILRGVDSQLERTKLLSGKLTENLKIGLQVFQAIHLAHPGIVMRPASNQNAWPTIHRSEHIPAAGAALRSLGL
jgi:uracil-DNA glycosylase